MATSIGLEIKGWLREKKKDLNSDARMLGLGVGGADPELALAQYLGISDDHITLVEKQSLPDDLARLKQSHPKINYHYDKGLFYFLQHTREKYDLVTAFSLEHLFKDAKRMSAFIRLVSSKVKPGSIVYVSPYYGENLRSVWISNGFVPSYPTEPDRGTLFYIFQGLPK